jgi:hypothetical protein
MNLYIYAHKQLPQQYKEYLFPCQALVLHACNPSYAGGRDQEDLSLKLIQANSSQDPILKKTHHKRKALPE